MSRRTKFSNERVRSFLRDETGSAVLEASLVYPLLLAAVIALMLTAIVVYRQAGLYYAASVTAERAAYHWDNSKRHPVSGIVRPGDRDGLYWRLTEDRMLEGIFGWAGAGEDEVTVPVRGAAADADDVPARKLSAASAWLPSAYTGEATYRREPLRRTIAVRLQTMRVLAKQASGTVVEPAEFIRTVDLARYYKAKFGTGAAAADKRAQAADVLGGAR